MKIDEIKELTAAELEKKIREARSELLNHRLRKQTGQLEKTHLLKEVRRNIARMETILTHKRAS